jgi:glycosyltransferase involved in cell wall biosynthesis
MGKAKITIVASGRFHCFDLAEQLQQAERLAAIYTGYPLFKLRNTGVDQRYIRSIPWLMTPFLALGRWNVVPRWALAELDWQAKALVERVARRSLPDCEVVIALSGIGLSVGKEIQKRGGIYVCDRGSTHILVQERLLAEEYGKLGLAWRGMDKRVVQKELLEYETADAITLPSKFTIRSFAEMGVAKEKLKHVPYGVNLERFKRSAPRADHFRVLFAGALSVRKGLHYLLDAFQQAALPGAQLVLAGSITEDTPALMRGRMTKGVCVLGSLDRVRLIEEMSRASVMVLPSIEEGLALVLAQAMACGCPVVGSTHTGVEDLISDGREGFIVAPRNVDALVEKLTILYRDRALVEQMSVRAVERIASVGGWDAYGRAMMTVFDELLENKVA